MAIQQANWSDIFVFAFRNQIENVHIYFQDSDTENTNNPGMWVI